MEGGGRGGGVPVPSPTIFGSKMFFYVKSENTKFLLENNMWNFSLYIE